MSSAIKSPKDFWTGTMYAGFGAAVLWMAQDYSLGKASRMGPGYFPTVLAGLLIVFGVAAIVRGLTQRGEPFGAFAWKPCLTVLSATAAFGFLLPRAGFIVALAVLIFGSAAASARFRFERNATLLAIGLIAFCGFVFVRGLGLPMPLFGSWFSA